MPEQDVRSKSLKSVLSEHHSHAMKGRMGGAVMCICGQGAGGTQACAEYAELSRLTAERDAYKAALEHYSDEKNWYKGSCDKYAFHWSNELNTDEEEGFEENGWKVARHALDAFNQGKEKENEK